MLFSSQATRYTTGVLGDSRQIHEVGDELTDFSDKKKYFQVLCDNWSNSFLIASC